MTQWGKKNVIEFYSNNRNRLSHLYDSEKIPLNFIKKKKISSILDYGCAVGGFYEIFRKFLNKNKPDRIHTFNEEIIIDQPTFQDYLDNTQNIHPQIARPCRRNRQIPIADATITE